MRHHRGRELIERRIRTSPRAMRQREIARLLQRSVGRRRAGRGLCHRDSAAPNLKIAADRATIQKIRISADAPAPKPLVADDILSTQCPRRGSAIHFRATRTMGEERVLQVSQDRAKADSPGHWPAGGCQSSTLFPSGSMTQPNFPYSESSIFSRTLHPSSRKALTRAWTSSTR